MPTDGIETKETPKRLRGILAHKSERFGTSVLGAPLEVFLPQNGTTNIMVLAGQHGDEPETTSLLSAVLRALNTNDLRCAVVLALNPDGLVRGTRGNGNGVDLNRNFPASNWKPDIVLHSWDENEPKTVELSPGTTAASEPETISLLALMNSLTPEIIVSLHARLACVDDPRETATGLWLSRETGLRLVKDIGYPTPGSLGSWAKESNIDVVTLELPDESIISLRRGIGPVLMRLLAGNCPS
jgi:murein peptide amidase A